MPSRRELLGLAVSGSIVGTLSGCLAILQERTVDLEIKNGDTEEHLLNVEFKRGDEKIFENEYRAPSNEEVEKDDVVASGEYTVVTTIDDSQRKTFEFWMYGCIKNSLVIEIGENSDIEMFIGTQC